MGDFKFENKIHIEIFQKKNVMKENLDVESRTTNPQGRKTTNLASNISLLEINCGLPNNMTQFL